MKWILYFCKITEGSGVKWKSDFIGRVQMSVLAKRTHQRILNPLTSTNGSKCCQSTLRVLRGAFPLQRIFKNIRVMSHMCPEGHFGKISCPGTELLGGASTHVWSVKKHKIEIFKLAFGLLKPKIAKIGQFFPKKAVWSAYFGLKWV